MNIDKEDLWKRFQTHMGSADSDVGLDKGGGARSL